MQVIIRKNKFEFMIDTLFIIVACFFAVYFTDYDMVEKKILGIFILAISFVLVYKHKGDSIYLILFSIIAYCNLTIVLSDCFTNGVVSLPPNTLEWQIYRGTKYEITVLNSLLLFLSIVNWFSNSEKVNNTFDNNEGIVPFVFGYAILVYGLITGYKDASTAGTYVSATSTLYEYCILFFLLTWFYAGKKRIRHAFLLLYAFAYVLQALVYGDRSSAFPLIVMLVILYYRKVTLAKVLVLSLCGIFSANLVSVYRSNYSLENFIESFKTRYGLLGVLSDTVSQAYYTGVAITAAKEHFINSYIYFSDFFIGILAGGNYGAAKLTTFTLAYAKNKGGGLVVSSFYFWFGYLGIVFLGIIVGLLIKKLKKGKNKIAVPWKIYITVISIRWYLYGVFDLFRGGIFVFLVAYIVFKYLYTVEKHKHIIGLNKLCE